MVERYTLKNGIPLFIVESHSSPVVSIQAWVARGSAHESDKLAGISHFLEHALFKGTRRRKVGEVALEIESRGGEINAFTSFEETAFYTTLASRYFDDGLDIIADIMQNPLFDKEEMEKEREVIIEEIKRAHDSPYRIVSMNLWENSFPRTPYGRPVLGYEKTVRKINHVTLRNYFEKNYNTGTMSLFIVGDIDKKRAFEKAEQKFQKVKKGTRGHGKLVLKIPRPSVAKVIVNQRDLKECHIQIGIPTPPITDPNIPSIDLMCSAVGQGESSRLYQRVVKSKRLAMEAHFGLMATSHCGLVALNLTVAPENIEAAIRESLAVIQDVALTGLEQSEIDRVKTSLEAEVIVGKETVEGYARRLGYYYSEFGDPEYEGKYLQALLAVDRERAGKALLEVFDRKPVVSIVSPINHGVDKKAIAALFARGLTKPASQGIVSNEPQKTVRDSLVFVTKPVDSLPTVAVRILFLGGTREESKEKQGVGTLFQRMWTAGTQSYSALKLAQTLESLGASLHGFCGKNTLGLSAEFLSKHWPVVKPLLSEVLLAPTFPEDEFSTEKELALREILSEKDSPGQLCQLNFLGALYGDHPYGRPPMGTKESVSAIKLTDVRDYYKNFVTKKRVVISSVGNLVPESWIGEINQIVSQLPSQGRDLMPPISVRQNRELNVVIEKKEPLFQSHLLVGFLGASFKSPERYALKLLSSCLAGQGGRLFLELRDKQSLAYQVAPMNSDSPEAGMFGFYIGCSPEKLEKALSGIRLEIEKVLQKPMDTKELDRAKRYWIGRFELEMQRYSAQAMLFGLDETYGLGFRHSLTVPDTIRAVGAKEIQEAAQKFLIPNTATISIVHNKALELAEVNRAWNASSSAKVTKGRERRPTASL